MVFPLKDINQQPSKFKLVENKIHTIMKNESVKELTIDRQYLPELFGLKSLEISKRDGLPIFEPFVKVYLHYKGILTDTLGNTIKLKKTTPVTSYESLASKLLDYSSEITLESVIEFFNGLKWYELQSGGAVQPSTSLVNKKKEEGKVSLGNQSLYDYTLKIALFGKPQFATTTLIQKYCSNIIQPWATLTSVVDFYVKTVEIQGKKIKLQLWDTSAENRFKFIIWEYITNLEVNGIIMIYNITNAEGIKKLSEVIEMVRENIGDIPIFLAIPELSTQMEEYNNFIEKYILTEITNEVGEIGEKYFTLLTKKILERCE
jgi:hypothetical protein